MTMRTNGENMRERIARAIRDDLNARWDMLMAMSAASEIADAVLAALAEPTEAMINHAMDAGAKLHPYAGQDAWARTHWKAMIAEASK